MFTSLFSPEVQAVLDNAQKAAGQPGTGPFPSPADWRDQVIYFLMVDRFNNPSAPPVHAPFDDPNYFAYQGGKLSGINQRLDYIKNLGAGAIWLSPVLKNLRFDNGSYHGYGIHDFLRADPRFATAPAAVVNMYVLRKQVEKNILSSHGDATRFFVTFLDNHDLKERLRYVQPGNEHQFDDQVTLGLACLHAHVRCFPLSTFGQGDRRDSGLVLRNGNEFVRAPDDERPSSRSRAGLRHVA